MFIFDCCTDEPKGGSLACGVVDPSVLVEKKAVVFASHNHDDHFNPLIFRWKEKAPDTKYILSNDIPAVRDAIMIGPGETLELDDLIIKTYLSTDEGVAFLVKTEDLTIYHAGDLNWWHWEGEPEVYNQEMAAAFQQQINLLSKETIDLAFVPLDPRQEQQYDWGMKYFLTHVQARHVVPMHFWGHPEVIDRLNAEPYIRDYISQICPLRKRGQYVDI